MRPAARLAAILALAAPLQVAPAALLAPVHAGPVADAARDAERLLSQGKPDEAAAALDKARDRLWREAPLTVKRAQFTVDAPQGFGVYEPRRTASFKAGETLFVYGEVSGYGYGRAGSQGEVARIEFEVSLSVAQAAGGLAIAPQSGKLALASRTENKEYMLALVYEPKGLPAGDYVLQADLRDVNSSKTTTIRLPFKVI